MKNKMKRFDVFIEGKLFDSVYFVETCDETYVRETLIHHDGYPLTIYVKGSKKL